MKQDGLNNPSQGHNLTLGGAAAEEEARDGPAARSWPGREAVVEVGCVLVKGGAGCMRQESKPATVARRGATGAACAEMEKVGAFGTQARRRCLYVVRGYRCAGWRNDVMHSGCVVGAGSVLIPKLIEPKWLQ